MKKKISLHEKAELAFKEAIKEVVIKHKKTGRPLVVWENGKVKLITVN